MKTLQSPVLRKMIQDRINTFGQGSDAFNFSLADSTGKKVRLEDLKGKVVLLDIWGHPCGGCKDFKKNFEKVIYPEMKERTDFAVVSISIDNTRKQWLSVIKEYSEPEFINVWTGGQGMAHPLVDYYKVSGFPKIVLIDKQGKLISATTPWSNMQELYMMIKKAL